MRKVRLHARAESDLIDIWCTASGNGSSAEANCGTLGHIATWTSDLWAMTTARDCAADSRFPRAVPEIVPRHVDGQVTESFRVDEEIRIRGNGDGWLRNQ